jgi:SAM-dependent methyltransferase
MNGNLQNDEPRDIHQELHRGLLADSHARLAFTRQAYQLLPPHAQPRILDLGCGQGAPTLELAKLSHNRVVGLDIGHSDLEKLIHKAADSKLGDRVQAVAASMSAVPFREGSFDILWAEGAIHIIGLERGLQEWRPLLKPTGFVVIHEMCWLMPDPPAAIRDRWRMAFPGIGTAADYETRIPACGYRLLDHFCLPDDLWWNEYYGPLAARILELRQKYAGNQRTQNLLDQEQQEVDLYRQHQQWYGSVYLIMQRVAS